MSAPLPFVREFGAGGPCVVCLHSNASSSSQWRALGESLAARYRVVAVDGYGAGKSPEWAGSGPFRLSDEVALIEPLLRQASAPVHLVGHSYGGAVALKAATLLPGLVRSVVAYEPTLFSLVSDGDAASSPASGIWNAATDAADAVNAGRADAAAERFIDFWMGPGSWAAMPPARQAPIAQSVRHVRRWRDALTQDEAPLSAFAALRMPVLLLSGDRSPDASLSVIRVLAKTLPDAVVETIPGLGHMGPVTDPEPVNARIAEFLDQQERERRLPG
jgi:pimeloyl-ACP methyl ester carboxylesterase